MSNAEVREQVLQGVQLPSPSEETPVQIYRLILKCTHKNPAERPAFIDIAFEFRLIIGGEANVPGGSFYIEGVDQDDSAYEMLKVDLYASKVDDGASKNTEYGFEYPIEASIELKKENEPQQPQDSQAPKSDEKKPDEKKPDENKPDENKPESNYDGSPV
jgi:hypothetical protein